VAYRDLREFIKKLDKEGELKRIRAEVDPVLEITEITDRVTRANGPQADEKLLPEAGDSAIEHDQSIGFSQKPGDVNHQRSELRPV
jgi:hypothetical protein